MPSAIVTGTTRCSGLARPVVTAMDGTVTVTPHKSYGTFATPAGGPNSGAADAVRDVLLGANWTLIDTIQAVGGLNAPFGWGYTGFQSHVCSISVDGIHGAAYVFYDPTAGPPPSGFIGSFAIVPVPIGASSVLSQGNLVAQINGNSAVTAVAVNPTTISLTAIAAGTAGNGIFIIGSGSITIGTPTSGGGWVLRSRSQYDAMASGNTARIEIAVFAGGSQGQLIMAVTIESYTVTFNCQQSSFWQAIADDFQVVFISQALYHAGDIYVFNSFLWAGTLNIPTNVPLSVAAFILQPNNLPNVSTLGAGHMPVDMWVGGTHTSGASGQLGWSCGMFHSELGPIADSLGNAVVQVPYVLMYVPAVGESRICGTLWNAFLTSIPQPLTQQFQEEGANYRVVATQPNYPPASILMGTAELNNLQTPATSNPPGANPVFSTGLGNVTILTAHEGNLAMSDPVNAPAQAGWLGKLITIGGTQYTVVAVSVPGGVAFSPAPSGPATNVAWSIRA